MAKKQTSPELTEEFKKTLEISKSRIDHIEAGRVGEQFVHRLERGHKYVNNGQDHNEPQGNQIGVKL